MIASARVELVARRALDDSATGLGWYRRALEWAQELSTVYGVPVETVAGVVAALSPLNGWASQLLFTPRILAAWTAVRDSAENLDTRAARFVETASEWIPGPGLGGNKRKAARIFCGESPLDVLGGFKVRAFYRSIMTRGDTDDVCIDRHAWSIADGGALGSLTPKRYRTAAAAYVSAAANLRAAFPRIASRLTPSNVQALCWIWWRDNPGSRF